MDGTSNRHRLDEKDAGTTSGYSTPSAPRSERESAGEATLVAQHHKMPADDPNPATTPSCEEKPRAGTAPTESVGAAGPPAAENGAGHEPATPVLPGWRFGLLGFG